MYFMYVLVNSHKIEISNRKAAPVGPLPTLTRCEKRGGAHMGFSERKDIILNWTELNLSWVLRNACKTQTLTHTHTDTHTHTHTHTHTKTPKVSGCAPSITMLALRTQ